MSHLPPITMQTRHSDHKKSQHNKSGNKNNRVNKMTTVASHLPPITTNRTHSDHK